MMFTLMAIIGLSSIVAVCFTGRNFLFLSELRRFQATSFRGSDRNLRLKVKKNGKSLSGIASSSNVLSKFLCERNFVILEDFDALSQLCKQMSRMIGTAISEQNNDL